MALVKNGNTHGLDTWWYENGTKSHEGMLKNGKPHGMETYWHDSGQKYWEIYYPQDGVCSHIEWDEEGNVVKIVLSKAATKPIRKLTPLLNQKNHTKNDLSNN